jgi:DNA sulfur modification protein DndD
VEAEGLLATYTGAAQALAQVERALEMAPEDSDEEMAQAMARLKESVKRATTLSARAEQLDRDIAAQKAALHAAQQELRRVLKEQDRQEFAYEDDKRMHTLAGRTREVMQEFLRRATERKIDGLARLIEESFRYLIRKKSLVERIGIDPASFAITLYDRAGHALARQQLSEGEKQIFAISVLWGLSRAATMPLPAIIDTPMARLDAAHRRNLVERYFPHASHQVIVLSTDTEVDHQAYEKLEQHVARAYHLNYDEATRATRAVEGYFWEGVKADHG